MENNSKLKQVTKIEYIGPYQIQTTSNLSINFTVLIEKYDVKPPMEKPIEFSKKARSQ